MFGVTSIQGLSSFGDDENLTKLINYNGFYRAFVVSTDDPLHLGRVKVRVPAIHGADPTLDTYMADSTLPWAFPGIFPLAGPDMGQLILPFIGSTVWVTFEVDQPNNPIYFGNLYSTAPKGEKYIQGPRFIYQGTQLQCTKDDLEAYKASVYTLFKSLKGASIIVDDSDMHESVKIEDALGQFIEMRNNGALLYYGMEPDKSMCELEISSGKSSIILNNKGISFKGVMPYNTVYYIKISDVSDDSFTVDFNSIFEDKELSKVPSSFVVGAKVVYINLDGSVVGFGLVSSYSSDSITISNMINLSDVVSDIYPVGSCYYALPEVDPNDNFNGTWEKLIDSEQSNLPVCWVRRS